MKSAGNSSPRWGWFQRISASAPASRRRPGPAWAGSRARTRRRPGPGGSPAAAGGGCARDGRWPGRKGGSGSCRQLGQVHGLIGMAQQGFGVLLVARVERDADAGAEAQRLAIDRDRTRQPVPARAAGCRRIPRRLLQADQQDDELVAAEPGHGVVLAHRFADAARDFDQHAVANGMAKAVVDRLEAVEVEVANRQQPWSRLARASACARRSASITRLGTPVSAS
jgi:hypothetical protein